MASLSIGQVNLEFSDLPVEIHSLPTDAPWEKDIKDFLLSWFDSSDAMNIPTSGSTGKPKEVRVLKEDMRRSARYTIDHFDLKTGMTALLCLPANLVAGKMMMIRCMEAGMNCLAFEPSARPLRSIEESVDFVAMTPYQVHHSLENEAEKFEVLATVIIGGAALGPGDQEKLGKFSNRVEITYGMTESITHIATSRISKGGDKGLFSLISKDFSITTDDDNRLVIKSPYLHMPVIKSQDVVSLEGNDTFRLLGRADNVINSGGVKIHPELLENKISKLMDRPYFIAGIPHDSLGEQVILFIEGPESENKGAVLAQLKAIVHPYECPKDIIFLDQFSYTSSHKINRVKTLEMHP